MNDFVRCNKLTAVYWLKEPNDVDNLQINIKLKPPDDIISLPKFEDYTNESNSINIEQNIETYSFKWQEKSFSASEVQRYKDIHNCLTENELIYHESIKNQSIVPQKVFSYVHEDYYVPLPQEKKKIRSPYSFLERLNLDDAVSRIGEAFGRKTDSESHLFKSQQSFNEEQQWVAMHVVFDKSEYNKDTLLIKQEACLLSVYHNTIHNYIITTPDRNNLETNPYAVEVDGELWGYQYEVQLDFGDVGDGDELVALLNKLHKKWEKKHKQLVNFSMPPLGKRHYYVIVELLTAGGFEMDDMYIEYDIKLSEGVQCREPLHGRTHVSESSCVDGEQAWHYGHFAELCLEVDSGIIDTPSLNIYLEAISVDFWRRHRTEGYCCLPLPLTPGTRSQELRCVRPDEVGADERRFFLGGCHLLKDLQVLSKPELQNGDYTYTETGTIGLRHSVVSQTPLPAAPGAVGAMGAQYETASASALLLGAEAALRKYRKARARLAHATTTV